MEKRRAHYELAAVKAVIERDGIFAFTTTARLGADRMGVSQAEAVAVVLALEARMLFKSMTTHVDSRVWQDVYHAMCPNGKVAYIKITVQDGATVIQFKEK
jgi:motility quorum-sensing regulator/GCU-specific mRNA interferase toxin